MGKRKKKKKKKERKKERKREEERERLSQNNMSQPVRKI